MSFVRYRMPKAFRKATQATEVCPTEYSADLVDVYFEGADSTAVRCPFVRLVSNDASVPFSVVWILS